MIINLDETETSKVPPFQKKPILVIVHPYFDPPWNVKYTKNTKFEEFLNSQKSERYNLLLLDTPEGLERVKQALKAAGKEQHTVLFAETVSDLNPQPKMKWKRFITKLDQMAKQSQLSEKRIIVGGRDIVSSPLRKYRHIKEDVQDLMAEARFEKDEARLVKARRNRAYWADVARAAKMKRSTEMHAGCAGITHAKLVNSQRFTVGLTRQFGRINK